ncbi:MAG: class I SAM-dependent methyltransferase [Clostridium argentinense]|uniref:Class I SAM-dependent methyltransferase n=1 Tax=Clostridium faecium TaxID=2762223 RepID=A0ABR8YQV4_9CLOT|nr:MULTISPECIES: class I SAM-dependent methyltransferase [Clostridium]MBD8046610.1 class I SAM-dependent methyltransferase [Clostridium faecium]MBS5824928.1 class I SAM-dependent methyltransferase [Clostridium argentinense]MDU1348691.1 class I SAM-dependent methyltransferase [Clostridium argentinense]
MNNSVFINLENNISYGNLLDICHDNYGVIYNLFKYYDEDCDIQYFEGRAERNIEKQSYDSCILFFSLNSIFKDIEKRRLINEIGDYLKNDGILYIWDIDKKFLKTYENNIKVYMPDKSLKEFHIKDYNILKDNSKEKVLNIINKRFEVINFKSNNGIYNIICRKRRYNR